MTLSVDRSSALLVRVWLEGGRDEFRARVMAADGDPDEAGSDWTIALASSPDQVVVAVRRWLEDFIGRGSSGGRDAPVTRDG